MCTILTEDYINLSATLAPGWMHAVQRHLPRNVVGGSDDNNTLNKLFHILSSISVCGWKCIYQTIGTVLIRTLM